MDITSANIKLKKRIGKKVFCVWLALGIVLTSVDFTVFAQEEQTDVQVESETVVLENIDENKETAGEEEVPKDNTLDDEDSESEEDNFEAGDEQNEVENPEGEENPEESENPNPEIGNELEGPEEDSVEEQEDDSEKEFDVGQKDQEETEQGDESVELAGEELAEDSGKCGDNLTWTLKDGTLTISGTGAMWNYNNIDKSPSAWREANCLILGRGITSIGQFAFYNCKSFTGELTIPEGVTSIKASAFEGCSGFTGGLSISEGVTNIETSAFRGCSGFTGGLTIPEGVTSIESLTFRGCSGFTGGLSIPEGVTNIGQLAFEGCSGFTGGLMIPEGVTSIGVSAFEGCSGFTGGLTIPEGVTSIGNSAFEDCSGFTGGLTIPKGVTIIGASAFEGCSGFTGGLTIPEGVTSIWTSAFEGCSGFTGELTIPEGMTSIWGGAFKDCSGFTGELTIPEGVTSIGDSAFEDCSGFIGGLTILKGIKDIGDFAFYGCSGFTGGLTIPEGVTSIGNSAFEDCSGFTGELMIPEGVTSIGNSAFEGCSGFTGGLTIPKGVTSIGWFAFSDCSGFTGELKISEGVTSIEDDTFSSCSGFIGDLTIPEGVTNIGDGAFYGCSGFTGELTIPEGVTSIGDSAFEDCSGFTGGLTILEKVAGIEASTFEGCSIGDSAFKGCSGFTGRLMILEGVTNIGDSAFYGCSGFTGGLTIPKGMMSIGNSAFYDCSGFTGGLAISGGVNNIEDSAFSGCSIGDFAFYGCSGFTSELKISEGVTSVGVCAFKGCSGFTGGLTIPKGMTSIGDSAFSDCSGFTGGLMISEGVTNIGNSAFKGCSGFTGGLMISKGVISIGNSAFYGCSGFTGGLTIPEGVTSIGWSAFYGCSGFTGGLIIPGGISIGDSAFYGCSGFTGGLTILKGTSIGDSAFYGCSGFTGGLTILKGTSIGDSAFYGCSGFTGGLTIPEGMTSIGNSTFSGCSGFTGELTISEGVTDIGRSAFYGCSGFTGGLMIPEGVTSIEKSSFSGCSNLSGNIYIPGSVSYIGDNAFSGITNCIIYGVFGSYAETYANKNNIPFVPYNFNGPENSGMELANCANIYVVDSDLKVPVAGALVNNIATDTNGHVALPVAEGGQEKYIGVTADGYIAYMSVIPLEANGTYYISLNPADGAFAVVYAKATIGSTVTNLLADKIYLQHTGEDISASSNKVMMEIEAAARGDVKDYALLQGDKVIASSTDGKFSIPILSANGSNSMTNLEAQKSVTLRATDVDGKIAAKWIGIYISPEGAVDIKEQDKSGSLSIGSDISVTLPDSIPFLGGVSASYGLKNPLPFELKVERNGQVKIAINKSTSESMEAFKENYDKLSERAKNLSNAASAFGGTPQPFGAGCLSASVSAKGYGEGYIDMSKPGTFEIKVEVIASGKGSGKYTQYFMAGTVPFYFSIEAGASISGAVTLSVKCGNSHIQSEGGVGTLSGKIYLTPKAGVGVEGMISVGISGTGACNYTWKPKDDYTKVWLSAYLELRADCFGWELNLWKSPEASYTIYESPKKNTASTQALYDSMTAKVYDSGAYTIMDRNYQEKGLEGARTTFGIRTNDGSGGCIQSYVYLAADPKLITAGNKFYLFWLQDIPGRSSENRAAVVYASSDDGANFTAPQQLIAESENQTLDNGIDVYVDNGKIYVCWQDASKSFSSGMSLNEVAQSQMISYAVIDATTGNVLSHETVTETAGCYLQPKIYVSNGQPKIAWIQNSMTSADGIWGADNQETLQVYDSATGVTETLSIGDSREKIVSMDGAVGDSQTGVVYALDTDGDLQTIEDRIIYFDTRSGSGGSRTALTASAGLYNNPVSEGGSIYWYSDGNISYTTVGSNAVATIYEEERADIGSNFRVLSEGNQTEILWNAIAYETEKVALYGIHSSGNGQWTSPYVIEQTDSEMTGAVSGSLRNGIPYISYMHIQNRDDGSKCHSLCVTQKKNVTDTVLNYAGYEFEELKPGQTLPITVELTNKGNTAVESVDIKIDGTNVGTENVNLGAGETGTFVLNQYTVPEGISSYSEHTLTVAAASEDNVSDNDYRLGIGYTDIKVLCSQRLQDEDTWLDISVLNDSDIASDVTLNIRANKEDGEILYTEELGTIEGRKGVSMTVSLRKYEDSCCTYFVEAVSGTEDVVEGNNLIFVYTGFGTDVPGGTLVSDPKFYTVTFQSNGGSEVESQQVEEDRSADEPPIPVRAGYRFTGWYLN